jgi:hypothetical protein
MELPMDKTLTLDSTQVSRRKLLVGGLAAGSATLLAATGAQAKVKLSKDSVKYTASASGGKNCGSCKLFRGPSSCVFVEGTTESNGACWIWQSANTIS